MSAVHGLSHDLFGPIRKKRKPRHETGVNLVTGAVYGVDANSIPVTVSHWVYLPAKQGARMMKRRGIVQ